MKGKWSDERSAGELPPTRFSCKHCRGPFKLGSAVTTEDFLLVFFGHVWSKGPGEEGVSWGSGDEKVQRKPR